MNVTIKDFPDGRICSDSICMNIIMNITTKNYFHHIQRFVYWTDLFHIPLKNRNVIMLHIFNNLCDDYNSVKSEVLNDESN